MSAKPTCQIIVDDVMKGLAQLKDESVHMVVSSPPYWNLRDYNVAGQIGLEAKPEEFITKLVEVFREVKRVLRKDGTVWVNLGDCYNSQNGKRKVDDKVGWKQESNRGSWSRPSRSVIGGKPKDLVGIPWRVAFALQADGWYLRTEIIWCLSGGAWVYANTQNGDGIHMLRDLVRLKPETVKLWNGSRWTQVLGWGPSNDTSNRLEIVLRSGERIGCTSMHLWPTKRGNVAAEDLKVGDVILSCTLPEPENPKVPPYLTDDLLWLLGLYLAEGSKSGAAIQLGLNADELGWLPRITKAAESIGATVTHTLEGNGLAVRIYGKIMFAVLDQYIDGRISQDVRLNQSVWRFSNRALKLVAEGYLDGDGSWDELNNRFRIGFCRNYYLERDLRTLAARLGASITLNPTFSKYQKGIKPSFRGEWRWTRSNHFNVSEKSEIVSIRFSRAREFYDVSVQDEPNLFSLSSGVLTHNCKSNSMPESIDDRPSRCHEYIFLLSKRPKYFYDKEAVKQPTSINSHARAERYRSAAANEFPSANMRDENRRRIPKAYYKEPGPTSRIHRPRDVKHSGKKIRPRANESYSAAVVGLSTKRNLRSVWAINASGYKGAHFATFPAKLALLPILAGTSAHGCCAACGAPYKRILKNGKADLAHQVLCGGDQNGNYNGQATKEFDLNGVQNASDVKRRILAGMVEKITVGWEKTCHKKCECTEVIPCTVLDCFSGSGTSLAVAFENGRSSIGIELNPEYAELSRERLRSITPLLFNK